MLSDFRLGLRQLAREPVVPGAIVLLIALGLATSSALYSVMDGLLFRPLPYRDADRLVHVGLPPYTELSGVARTRIVDALGHTPLLSERARASPALLFEEGTEVLTDWQLVPTEVWPDLFPMLGVRAALGRTFRLEDEGQLPRPVLLGHALWRSRFGGDPKIVGRTVNIPGSILNRPLLVVGIMSPGFDFPRGTNVWVTRAVRRSAADLARFPPEPTYARLAAGVTIEQVRRQFPHVVFTPLRESVRPKGGLAVAFLLGATGLLLLVAWAQVAALLFARAAGRAAEIAVRLALGASRSRLVRQFATEGFIVAVAALALAWVAVPSLTAVIVRLLPSEMTIGQAIHIDQRTLLFTCALSAAGVLFLALVPLEIVRQSAPAVLLRGAFFGDARLSAARLRGLLLVAQIAVTTTLIYLGGLAFHSFVRVTSVDLGFRPDNLVVFRLPLLTVPTRVPQGARAAIGLYVRRAADTILAVRGLPGVTAIASGDPPLVPGGRFDTFTSSSDPQARPLRARSKYATPGYFEALGVRVVDGRNVSERDVQGGFVALVNQTFARTLGHFGTVVGQQLTPAMRKEQDFRVIGVVNDFVDERPDLPVDPQVFLFYRSGPIPFVLVRVKGDPAQTIAAIRTMTQGIWTGLPVRRVMRMRDEAWRATADYRARTILLGLLGLLCVPLAVVGVGGALSYMLRQRTREIAIRLAMGADPSQIKRRVVARALGWVSAGLVLGLAGGLGVGRWMSSYLFGVRSADPLTAAGVIALLAITSWLSALWPATRAARLDPAAALREI